MKTLIITLACVVYANANAQDLLGNVLQDWTKPHVYGTEAMPQGPSMDTIYRERLRNSQPQQNNYYIQQQQTRPVGFGNFGDKDNDE